MESVRSFVYGTLRPGGHNHYRMDLLGEPRSATATGALYHVSPHGRGYPVAKFDEEGTIIGEVIDIPLPRWHFIVSMEEGAGYELSMIEVKYEDGSTEKVGAWHYMHRPRGPRILSGDWFGADADGDDDV